MRGQSFKIVRNLIDEYLCHNECKPFFLGDKKTPLKALHNYVRKDGYAYYAASAYSGKKSVPKLEKSYIRNKLFSARILLEKKTEKTIEKLISDEIIDIDDLLKNQFFGISKKQGISFRLGLSSCTPTVACSKYCYAHDGRERSSNIILRCCINSQLIDLWYKNPHLSYKFENKILKAVKIAKNEAIQAEKMYKFKRNPRIRLSHVGDLGNYPEFTNWIASKISELSSNDVLAVLYTRSKRVKELNSENIIINYSIDSTQDQIDIFPDKEFRIVSSAWDGQLNNMAKINFLEHHDNNFHSKPKGSGMICPVTNDTNTYKTCDEAHCDLCFRKIN